MKIKEFEVHPSVSISKLERAGFRKRDDFYYIRYYPNEFIHIDIMINPFNKELRTAVKCNDGIYAAFYNYSSNNKVATKVINEYNNFLYSLCKQKILKRKKSNMAEEKIKIKYHSDKIEKLRYIDGKSDWIDLRAAENVKMNKGDFRYIDLGISVKLPEGYEMIIAPRSSTFKNFGIIQPNSPGVIDCSYCGDDDIIKMPALAMRDTEIHINDRICQFRIQKNQPSIEFQKVDTLGNESRGGFGSTGKS